MNGWAVATDLAIWTLILGSVVVFGWFLTEVLRPRRRPGPDDDHPGARDGQ